MKNAIFANSSRACAALLIVLAVLQINAGHFAVLGQTYPGKIGIGIGDGRGLHLTDAARTLREWRSFGVNQAAPLDEVGWPTTDAWTVIFDYRPTNAWNFPAQFIDDPERYQVDVFGTYLVSFKGSADLTAGGVAEVNNVVYDPASNTTTAEVNVLRAEITATNNASGLLILNFRNTRRTPESALNSGITDLRLLRPGISRESNQILTSPFLSALLPFSVVRYMDFLETNHRIFYGTGDWIDWADRRKLADATQESSGQAFGYAWEYVALIGNLSNRDLWINIPAEASDEYITELARLMRDRVNPDLNLYLEYSNEVWNFGFGQYVWNKAAARDEVCDNYAAPFTTAPPCTQISMTSNLNIPDVSANTGGGRPNREEIWARRRHARRTKEIGDKFREVFCEAFGGSAKNRIRPVLSWWAIQPQEYDEMLQWLRAQYGEPSGYLYGIATTAYFGVGTSIFQNPTATVEEILAAMGTSLNNSNNNRQRLIDVARAFDIKAMTYESGSATGDVNSQFIFENNIANRIRAERSQRNGELSRSNLADHWFNLANGGGDLFMQFALVSAYNRFGSWGLTDDIADVNRNFKYNAVAGLSGTIPLDAPVGLTARAGNRHVKLSWEPVSGATGYHLRRGTSPWGPFIMIGRNLHSPKFNDVRLKNGRTYYYVVSSVNDSQVTPAGEGTSSNPPLASTPRKRHRKPKYFR
ncbi:MAG: fibronectin type III domain-containing protein [Acidobacteria bacterium]|nr:fibronectin type III domain-containing protein [Acidobacteriota bacterium]